MQPIRPLPSYDDRYGPAMDWLTDLPWASIGVIFGVIAGGIGAVCGVLGLVHASKSNQTADAALALARREDERAERAEAIAREHRDVRWDQHETRDCTLSLENVGTTEARDVEMTMRMEGFPTQVTKTRCVAPGERVGWHLTSQVREHRERRWAMYEGWRRDGDRRQNLAPRSPEAIELIVEVTVTWRSPAGASEAHSLTCEVR